jgi:dienelactone hydrolase
MEKRVFVKCEDHDIPMVIVCPDNSKGPFPTILMLHGFMSYKEGDGFLFSKAAEEFKKNGIASARIDFASMGENRFSRENYGLSIMLKETKRSFEFLLNDPEIDSERIGILGHSLGARVAFLSSQLPSKCLIALNGAIDVYKENPERFTGLFKPLDNMDCMILSLSDGRKELLYQRFFDENSEYVSNEIFNYTNPILVCVAENDPTLRPEVSYDFVKEFNANSVEMLTISEANHTFNAKTGDYTKVNELLDKMKPWLIKNLKQ